MKASSEEIYGKCTQGTTLKSNSVGYNAVVDNTGLSSFVWLLLVPRSVKSVKLFKNSFKLIADQCQGYWSWCQSKVHMRLPISHHNPCLRSHHRRKHHSPCLKPSCSKNPFHHSLSDSFWTTFTDVKFGPDLVVTVFVHYSFFLYIFRSTQRVNLIKAS